MRKSESSTGSRLLRAGIATAATAAVVVGAAGTAFAASVPLTLSSTTGPAGGGNTITATAGSAIFGTGVTPVASFQVAGTSANCSATYVAAATVTTSAGVVVATSVRKVATNKVAVTVPAGVTWASGSTTAPVNWNLCVYSGTTVASGSTAGSPLIGNAKYTIALAPTITSVTPSSGPALGGTTIKVVGTNFPATGMTATLGGTALTNIVVAADKLSFTATTPAHVAATNQTLSITTPGGTVNRTNSYAFTNGITISPNTAPSGGNADVDVMGAGLGDMFAGWSTPANASTATPHIYLVDGNYDPSNDATVTTNKKTPPIQDCDAISIIGPTEVVCTFDLANSLTAAGVASTTDVPDGTYTVTVVNNGGLNVQPGGANAPTGSNPPFLKTILTSGATFTVAPY